MMMDTDLDTVAPIERMESVDSTSLLARRKVAAGEIGESARFFVAKTQTGGVGRFGRSWASPAGGLWCTLAWPLKRDPKRAIDGLGLRVGAAMIRAIEHVVSAHGHGERVMLKWPNDAMLSGKKVAGVLCETIERDGKTFVLAGVGVNANFAIGALPRELHATATTLQDELGGPVNLERLTQEMRRRLCEAAGGEGLPVGTLADIRNHLHGVGANATITLPDRRSVQGVIEGLTDDGRLKMRTPSGEFIAPSGAETVIGGVSL